MFVNEVADLFRDYCDEPDTTFLTNANVATYLKLGYGQFREVVINANPQFYAISQDISLSNANSYDFATAAVKIMGARANLTAPRVHKIVTLYKIDGSGNIVWFIKPVGNLEQLYQNISDNNRYCLVDIKLHFAYNTSGDYRLWYVPVDDYSALAPALGAGSGVDWTGGLAATTTEIDELYQFHDLIALYAYEQYAIRDGGISAHLQAHKKKRIKELEDYVVEGKNLGANQVVHVQSETWY